jgi:hypothetical protein
MTLYVGLAPGLVAYTVVPVSNWWPSVSNGTLSIVYDAAYNVTDSSLVVQTWSPIVGGTAPYDTLARAAGTHADWPKWTDDDYPYFGHRPSVYAGDENLCAHLQTSGSGLGQAFAQPHDTIVFSRSNSASDNLLTRIGGSAYTFHFRRSTAFQMYAGESLTVGPSQTVACVAWLHWEGSTSRLRVHFQNGDELDSGDGNAGSPGTTYGLGIFAAEGGGCGYCRARLMGIGRGTGVTTDDWARLIEWSQRVLQWN